MSKIIECKKKLTEIKKCFNWKHYIYLNNITEPLHNKSAAWHHFKNIGFDLGLKWNIYDNFYQDEKYKILIVMPTYNRSNKIEDVIQMIQHQTFNNWVFLIIDDGSNEHNKLQYNNIKQKYSNHNKILFLENETNSHIAKTLNIGIDYLLSNYFTHFTWISDDNEYYPDFLNLLINGNTYFTYSSYHVKNVGFKTKTIKNKYIDYKDLINTWGGCASFMWTKQAIQQIGYYNECVPCCEDYEYIIRTFKLFYLNCKFIDIPLMKYIVHKYSLTKNNKANIIFLTEKINNIFLNQTVNNDLNVNNDLSVNNELNVINELNV